MRETEPIHNPFPETLIQDRDYQLLTRHEDGYQGILIKNPDGTIYPRLSILASLSQVLAMDCDTQEEFRSVENLDFLFSKTRQIESQIFWYQGIPFIQTQKDNQTILSTFRDFIEQGIF